MSPEDFKTVVSNGTWDACKMHVLYEIIRLNTEVEKMEKKLDRITWIGITVIVGIVISVAANIILKGIAP